MASPDSSSQNRPTRLLTQQEKLAHVYEEEVYPLYGQKFADLLTANLTLSPHAHVLQIGCGLGSTRMSCASASTWGVYATHSCKQRLESSC